MSRYLHYLSMFTQNLGKEDDRSSITESSIKFDSGALACKNLFFSNIQELVTHHKFISTNALVDILSFGHFLI